MMKTCNLLSRSGLSQVSRKSKIEEKTQKDDQKFGMASNSNIFHSTNSFQTALSIHLIRRNIYRFLDYTDLINCSVVSKTWHSEIKQQFTHQIPHFLIHLHYTHHSFCVNWPTQKLLLVEKTLQGTKQTSHMTFHDLKSKLRLLPRKRIWLDCQFCCLKSLQEFLQLFQSSVTHLTLGHFEEEGKEDKNGGKVNILKYLYKNIPHLEYFGFNQPQMIQKIHPNSRPQISFTRLRIVKLEGPDWCEEREMEMECVYPWPFLQQILRVCPALKKIYGFPLESTYLLGRSDTKILSKIRSLCYEFDGQLEGIRSFLVDKLSLNQLNWLIENKMELEELNLTVDFPNNSPAKIKFDYKQSMTQLVKLNAPTLRKLTLSPTHKSQRLEIPQLENLDTLEFFGDKFYWLEKDVGGEVGFYEAGQKLSHIFPNIIKIVISISVSPFTNDEDQLASFQKFFPPANLIPSPGQSQKTGQVMESVRELKLERNLPTVCLAELSGMLPGVKSIILNYNYRGMRMHLSDCCQLWSQLEEITIEFDVLVVDEDEEDEEDEDDFWDSWLTGFSEDMCREIRNDPWSAPPLEMVEQCRIYDSICDLQSLKILKFKFTPFDELNEENYPKIFSFVTGTYAFGLRPELKVLVDVNYSKFNGDYNCIKGINKMLEPIASHVFINF